MRGRGRGGIVGRDPGQVAGITTGIEEAEISTHLEIDPGGTRGDIMTGTVGTEVILEWW